MHWEWGNLLPSSPESEAPSTTPLRTRRNCLCICPKTFTSHFIRYPSLKTKSLIFEIAFEVRRFSTEGHILLRKVTVETLQSWLHLSRPGSPLNTMNKTGLHLWKQHAPHEADLYHILDTSFAIAISSFCWWGKLGQTTSSDLFHPM